MKIIATLFTLLFGTTALHAQNIGIGTATPHPSALLDIASTSKGLLPPRMTTAQRNTIAVPAKGMLVYDTDLNALYHYNGSGWAAVGSGGGGFSLPYSASPGLAGVAFKIDNTGTAIQGAASAVGGYGVVGSNHSASGFGVGGLSSSGTAVYGFSAASGTALRGISNSGYGLYASGNVRLNGGNTNPSAGAVLTSIDNNGNAVWKKNAVAFKARGAYNALKGFPNNSSGRKLHFAEEVFDYSNSFTPTTSSSPTAGMSTFEIPVNGLYHFDLSIMVTLTDTYDDFEVVYAFLRLTRGGVDYSLHFTSSECCNANLGYEVGLYGSTDVQLVQGDRVWVQFYQRNDDDAVGYVATDYKTTFSGHLVIAD